MKDAKLWKYVGKKIRIITDDGQVFEGIGCDFTFADENEPEIDSICIGDTEFYENEIVSIEELND